MNTQLVTAAVALKARHTELREFPMPDIPADAGVLRVSVTGVCGSDWPIYLNDKAGPRILGHEMIGTVEMLGPLAFERWGLKLGDRVALEEYLPCGHCHFCRTAEYRSCPETDAQRFGAVRYGSTPVNKRPSLWGGYSQFVYLHPRSVFHRLPSADVIPDRIAAMALPIGNGFQWAYLDGGAGPGKTIIIQGPGQQGLGCVIAAKAAGASCIIVSGLARDADRLDVAKALGADHVVAVDQQDLRAEVERITSGRMADLVIDVAGGGPEIFNNSLALLHRLGVFQTSVRRRAPLNNFDIDQLVTKQVTFRGMRGHSFQAVELALRTMQEGKFPLHLMTTHLMGLHEVDAALRMVGGQTEERSIHISVDPWKT